MKRCSSYNKSNTKPKLFCSFWRKAYFSGEVKVGEIGINDFLALSDPERDSEPNLSVEPFLVKDPLSREFPRVREPRDEALTDRGWVFTKYETSSLFTVTEGLRLGLWCDFINVGDLGGDSRSSAAMQRKKRIRSRAIWKTSKTKTTLIL